MRYLGSALTYCTQVTPMSKHMTAAQRRALVKERTPIPTYSEPAPPTPVPAVVPDPPTSVPAAPPTQAEAPPVPPVEEAFVTSVPLTSVPPVEAPEPPTPVTVTLPAPVFRLPPTPAPPVPPVTEVPTLTPPPVTSKGPKPYRVVATSSVVTRPPPGFSPITTLSKAPAPAVVEDTDAIEVGRYGLEFRLYASPVESEDDPVQHYAKGLKEYARGSLLYPLSVYNSEILVRNIKKAILQQHPKVVLVWHPDLTVSTIGGPLSKLYDQLELLITEVYMKHGQMQMLYIHLEQARETKSNPIVAIITFLDKMLAALKDRTLSIAVPRASYPLKLVMFDLNGVFLCKSTRIREGAIKIKPNYWMVPRPGVRAFIERLISYGLDVGIYTSTPQPNAQKMAKHLDILDLLVFAWYRNHCPTDPEMGPHATVKLVSRIVESKSLEDVESVNKHGMYTENNIVIVDDSWEKLRLNPVSSRLVVKTYDPETDTPSLREIEAMIVARMNDESITSGPPASSKWYVLPEGDTQNGDDEDDE